MKTLTILIVLLEICLLAGGAIAEETNLRESDYAFYSFENTLVDSSGNRNSGDGVNVSYVEAHKGMGVALDGSGYIRIPSSADSTFSDTITVEMWIYQTRRMLGETILLSSENAEIRLWMLLSGDTTFSYRSRRGIVQTVSARTDDFVMMMNTWIHLCAVIGDGFLALYVDGKEVGRKEISPIDRNIGFECGDLFIGGFPGGPGLIGIIDEVRISKLIAPHIPPLYTRLTSFPSKGMLKVTANAVGVYGEKGLYASVELNSSGGERLFQQNLSCFTKGLAEAEFPVATLEPEDYPVIVALHNGRGDLLSRQEKVFTKLGKQPWEGTYERLVEHVVPPPWSPVKFSDNTITTWGRRYRYNGFSLFPVEIVTAGASILSGPIRLKGISGGKPLNWTSFSPLEIIQQTDPKITLLTGAQSQNLNITAQTEIEYDGMMKVEMTLVPRGEINIEELVLELPLKSEYAEYFWNLPGEWDFKSPNAGKLPDTWGERFRHYIWVGDTERGISWFADSHRNWNIDKKLNATEIRKSHGSAVISIHFVNKAFTLTEKRTIVFGLQATPMKPRPTGWRRWRYGNWKSEQVTIGNQWNDPELFRYHFFPVPRNPEDFNRIVDENHEKRRKITAYVCRGVVTPGTPVWKYYNGDWYMHTETGGTCSGIGVQRFGESIIGVCPEQKEYSDYLAYLCDNWFNDIRADGLYIDGIGLTICEHPDHNNTCHYFDNNGDLQHDLHLFAERKSYKCYYTIAKIKNPENLIIVHMSSFLYSPLLSFADAIVDGEQFRKPDFTGDYIESSTLDQWQAQFSGRQFGLVQFFLSELDPVYYSPAYQQERWRTRGLLSLSLLHDCRLYYLRLNQEEILGMWNILDAFGMENAGFIPYWSKGGELRLSDDVVKASAYFQQGKKALIVITNTEEKDTSVTLTFDLSDVGLSNADTLVVRDAYTDKIIPHKGNSFHIAVPGKDFRLVKIALQER